MAAHRVSLEVSFLDAGYLRGQPFSFETLESIGLNLNLLAQVKMATVLPLDGLRVMMLQRVGPSLVLIS